MYSMQYITTTELRTQSAQLVKQLNKGNKIVLMHRSRVIGFISPETKIASPIKPEELKSVLKNIRPKKLIPESKREIVYKANLLSKYGKDIS
jgi:antitoxin (DNA-binding transcriptional repressor) of toxin-antitoxin stability system